ncbi:OmpA family protein [Flavobacterium caeni]|uniref:WD40-like Beta Propeller Repeat n=1 Tax=Flavobacterium caeni TaxID=490189 RepID=A0A1G5CU45_9FLAO|nr:OmpA family protein [Flavobacterium caeni]SCY05768.1 WD40-like Beta Propeller Repeat [Flavobacterium caeni]
MKNKAIIFLSFLSLLAVNSFAQVGLKKADKQYAKYAYIDATQTYERIAAKGYKSPDMFMKLGNAYYFNAELEKANKWYGELFAMGGEIDSEYYYRYAQTLKSVGDYAKADQMMTQFNQKSGEDLRGKNFVDKKDYMEEIKANSGRYEIADAGINSKYSDYGSAFNGKQVIFASSRDTGNFAQKKHKWSNQYFTGLYSAEMSEEGALTDAKKYAKQINTKYHEASAIFTKDGKTMYFTRNNFNNGKKGKDANRITLLKLYKATFKDSVWSDPVEVSFNSDSYSVAHPSLSPDEKTLYFASDMPGTLGQSDLWKVAINGDSFGTPVNLGPTINTEGKETFPFLTDENELYFSTDGHPGVGGLDIFMAKLKEDGTFKAPLNVGTPANSPQDDFAYLIDTKSRRGFLSSNRDGGQGYDDIYRFLETRKLVCEQVLSGVVTDLETGEVIPGAKVTLMDDKFNKLKEVIADDKGFYDMGEVECGKVYWVRGEQELYETKEQKITISKTDGKTDLPIQLEKKVKPVTVGDDLAKAFGIKIIYFDLDKWNIRPDAALELEKILDVMKQYPTMKIDIRSHTDCRASHKYNERLSDRRAKSTMEWLIKNGVDSGRLSAKGYGENQLVNHCADGVKCSEDEHQANRRSEFIITAL